VSPKPRVSIDEDGDGDVDVTVEIDTPATDPTVPPDLLDALTHLVAQMEVHITPPTVRITYAGARETLRGLIN